MTETTRTSQTHQPSGAAEPGGAPEPGGRGLTGAAAALAYAGALPLIFIAVIIWARPPGEDVLLRQLAALYGGLLLAFFGGVRWGIAAMRREGPDFRSLAGAVAPLLLAIPVFLMSIDPLRIALIAVALPVLLADDLMATKKGSGAPGWYLAVRIPLTVMLELALLAILIRILLY